MFDAGVDVVTSGNHIWDKKEIMAILEREPRLLRPANYPPGLPGTGCGVYETAAGVKVGVMNLEGRVFMKNLDCPFRAVESELDACRLGEGADAIVIDFHAEATSEKQAMGFFADGRASFVVGTHTHVPTADDQILTGGTAYLSDAGMTGNYDSILGMVKDEPINRFLTRISERRFEAAPGDATLCGAAVETDDKTGLATAISPIRIGGRLRPIEPDFWGG